MQVLAAVSSENPGDNFSATGQLSTGQAGSPELLSLRSIGKSQQYRTCTCAKPLMRQAKIRLFTESPGLYY